MLYKAQILEQLKQHKVALFGLGITGMSMLRFLLSQNISPDGPTLRTFIGNFVSTQLDNYLHKNEEAAKAILDRIMKSEKERKEIAGIKKLAKKRAKSTSKLCG